jgi:hypothetical protein
MAGTNPTTIVPAGRAHTPKQIQLDKANGKLYWSDREGMRGMLVNLDASDLEASFFGICAATEDEKEGTTHSSRSVQRNSRDVEARVLGRYS